MNVNRWTEIKSYKDLPTEKGHYFVFTVDKEIEVIYADGNIRLTKHTSAYWLRKFTHIIKIEEPNKPF